MIRTGVPFAGAQAGLRTLLAVAAALTIACGGDSGEDDADPIDGGSNDASLPDTGDDQPDTSVPDADAADGDAGSAPSTITAKQIAVDYRRACALREDGTVTCWGEALPSDIAPPTPPPALSSIAAPIAGRVCGLDADGAPHCWGVNTNRESEPPASIKLKRISTGGSHSCGLLQDGTIRCWGRQPADIPAGTGYTELATSTNGVCALSAGGQIVCSSGEVPPPQGQYVQLVAFGTNHCAIRDSGTVACWPNLTAQVPADERFVQVSVGTVRGCGVRADGSATCWSTPFAAPQQPPANEMFSSVQVGETFTCGLRKADKRVLCWGVSPEGATNVPVEN